MDLETKLTLPGEFDVIAYDVPDFVGDWTQGDYGDPNAERIQTLREEFGIDEIVCKPSPEGRPLKRIAQHRARVTKDHQENLLLRVHKCWKAIEDEHPFAHLPKEESDARCQTLDMTASSTSADPDENADWFTAATRSSRW